MHGVRRTGGLLAAAATLATMAVGHVKAAELYVSPRGSDRNPGSLQRPLRTFAAAQRAVKRLKVGATGPIHVLFRGGTYYLPETVRFTPEDSGTRRSPIVYAPYRGETVVLSGGVRLQLHWEPSHDGILEARVPEALRTDQLYVNGMQQVLARYPNYDPNERIFNGYAKDSLSKERAARWSDPQGGFIHAMHPYLWGDAHYVITGKDHDGKVTYEGGWQNNRAMGMHGEYRFVENIREELDAPGEWFLDRKRHTLAFYPPSGLDLPHAVVEGVRLRTLIEFRGSSRRPVRYVTLRGFTFRHAARTFMENREPLLRSDWTTYRGGALFLQGCEDCTVEGCFLDRLGGNALFVSGYNRRITIRSCHIAEAGANGVAFVGDPGAVRSPLFHYDQRQNLTEIDLTPGPRTADYPADCLVDDCLIHRTGRVEKQTAPIEIAMSRGITVRHCSLYDVPRAGINIGDGCWGGHVIEGCDIFDTVKETGDHGSFNSWGRDRYWGLTGVDLNRVTQGEHRDLPLLDTVQPVILRNNRWRCDHGWDIDLDDGSTNYRIVNNLCLNGGIKLREGFYRVCENNVMVNNSFHPHVWFEHSQDVFRHNIVFTLYQPIGMPKVWGAECDGNLLYSPGATAPVPATALQGQSGQDAHSITADARFLAPAVGDYRVAEGSPALALGFQNFPMDRFGVRSPALHALARTPLLPKSAGAGVVAPASGRDGRVVTWLGAKVKNVVGMGEVSAAGLPGEVGIWVVEVPAHSAAAEAGLRKADVIRGVDASPTDTVEALLSRYAEAKPGQPLHLSVWRGQQEIRIVVVR
jgi:hypothetical protein